MNEDLAVAAEREGQENVQIPRKEDVIESEDTKYLFLISHYLVRLHLKFALVCSHIINIIQFIEYFMKLLKIVKL